MTNADMTAEVQQWLGLQSIASYNEAALIPKLLQRGTIDLLSRTRCVVRCIDLRVLADVGEYLLDHSVLSLLDVDDGSRRRLRRNQQTGVWGFTLIGSDVLRIVPTPTEAGEIQVWAVLRPGLMVNPDDSPGQEQFGAIPDEFHDAIVTYALWKGADYADDSTSQNGDYYRNLYEGPDGRGGRLSQIRTLVNKRGTARGARVEVRLSSVSPPGSYT